ncbi:uncharacterized protein LOC126886255 [Diabrotica virgifera virgifera]|uniref:DUF7869 domain-containing protein n=1 Tax=Diabrotica virgifera virgifera TaxID=50390 RepID=A0ABM5KFV1_DIAVI|nr:uncharacterized protein LOC126886255 [Diabrotica virgifera virgifera]
MTNDDTCGSGNNNFLETQLPKKAMDKGTSSSSSDSSSSSNSSSSSKSSSSSNTSSDTDNSSQHSKTDTDPYGSDDSIADPPFNPPVIKRQVKITTGNAIKKRKVKDPSNNEKVGRKKLRQPATWKQADTKRLRNGGEAYLSTRIVQNADGTKTKSKILRPAKTILPPCGNKCKLKCSEKLDEAQRNKIFKEYWNLNDLDKQREYISSNLKAVAPRYRYSNKKAPRKPNNAYYFLIDGQQVRVCKYFFMATLSINHKIITTVLRKQTVCETGKVIEKDKRGKHGKHQKISESIKNSIRAHINSIPRKESHYCRSHSSKEYIEGSKTITDLHRDYLELCKEQNVSSGNYLMYFKIFNEEFNLAFHVPKKDQCEECLRYRSSSEEEKASLQEKFDKHLTEKDLSRTEKDIDKHSDGTTKVVVYDLQAVLPCPTGEASSFYYVSKLNVFNFTLYDIKSHEGTCFLWHEGEALRGSNEIGSCILKFLQNICNDENLNIIFYSDNCAGQNKNKFIIALYLYAINNLPIKSITHKFFVPGHGQSEGDSVHAMIEKQIKKYKKSSPIYVPDQYGCIIRTAKKTGSPYKVHEMGFNDVFDLKALCADLHLTIPKNFKISDVRILMLDRNNPTILNYKSSFNQPEYDQVEIVRSRREINVHNIALKKAFTKKVGITEAKKNGLLSLIEKKRSVPDYYLSFYKNL